MVAYFDMLRKLIIVMALISVLMIPAIVIYKSYSGLSEFNNYAKAGFSLGNMGYSGANC